MNEKPKVELIGKDGNAFTIISECKKAWKGNNDSWNKIQKEMMSGDYNHLLFVANEYFEVS